MDKLVIMNDLEKFFWNDSDRYIHKWSNYFKYYDRYFDRFRNKNVRVLEIGVYKGGSLQMWKSYFGKDSLIVGMDIDGECLNYVEEGIEVFIGDQGNINDLSALVNKYKNFDIIIDDGSHLTNHQIFTFEYLYDYVNAGGIYLVEDVMTSYWTNWITSDITFVEYSKKIIDDLAMYHVINGNPTCIINGNSTCVENEEPLVTKYTKSLDGIYFHNSMVFFEKSDSLIHKPVCIFSVGMRQGKIN
jgi:hypothetical protein